MKTRSSLLVLVTVLLTGLSLTLPAPAAAQITSYPETVFHVTLTRLPGVATSALGTCSGLLEPASGRLDMVCTRYVGSVGATVVTLGPPNGSNMLFELGGGPVVSAERNLTDDQVAAMLTGQLWVAMTTSSHPNGEIGARLVPRTPVGESVMRFPLREDSLVYSGSGATGDCALRFDRDKNLTNLLCTHDVDNPVELRVLVDGGTVATRSDVDSPFEVSLPLLLDNYSRFLDGDYGLVLTSAAYPNGEIGMVLDKCIESPTTLCLNDERFRVSVQVTPPGQETRGARTYPDRSRDAGLFWFFNPDNWEIVTKVLNGCTTNQRFWVFVSANTTLRFELTVYDTLTGRQKVYSNPQGKKAVPVADTNAFPCS